MPWTKKNFPDSLKNLPLQVRNKAIEIGDALIEDERMEEGIAIATAISRAKDWAAERGIHYDLPSDSRKTDVKVHGQDRYVIPYEDKWAVKVEGGKTVEKIFRTNEEAVKRARKETKAVNGTLTI
jgi:uncharacterized protein YdaT